MSKPLNCVGYTRYYRFKCDNCDQWTCMERCPVCALPTDERKPKPMTHELKIWPEHFAPVLHGEKTAELRFNDRLFMKGDLLHFHEWDPNTKEYTGNDTHCMVLHVTTSAPIPEGFALISMSRANVTSI